MERKGTKRESLPRPLIFRPSTTCSHQSPRNNFEDVIIPRFSGLSSDPHRSQYQLRTLTAAGRGISAAVTVPHSRAG